MYYVMSVLVTVTVGSMFHAILIPDNTFAIDTIDGLYGVDWGRGTTQQGHRWTHTNQPSRHPD